MTCASVPLCLCAGSFIAGYALSSLVFGHLVHYFNPFSLIAVGLSCWCGAVIVSGLSPNYWILLIARIFRFGEW